MSAALIPLQYLLLRFSRHATDNLRCGYPQESHVQLSRYGVRQQSLTATRRAMQEDASGLQKQYTVKYRNKQCANVQIGPQK